MSALSSSLRTVFRVALLLYVVGGLFYIARTSFEVDGQRVFSLWDDAMVSMRYARYLAMGQGLVSNAWCRGRTDPPARLRAAVFHVRAVDSMRGVRRDRLRPVQRAVGFRGMGLVVIGEDRRPDVIDCRDRGRGLDDREDFRNLYAEINAGPVEFVMRKASLGKPHDPAATVSAIAER